MILNFIILYLIISLFNGFIMRYESNILGCGLVGFYPKKDKEVDLNKIYFLTIAIEERGSDSCGFAVGGAVYKGKGTNSKSKDFIANELLDLKLDLLNKPIIFHNRSATIKSSLTDEDNIHPFKWVSETNESNYIIGAHNGTLKNYEKLKEKFCENYDKSLFKIDSHYLLLSLYATIDKSKVLEAYEGAAALLFYNKNVFYVWKGAANDVEERPLNYVETDEGWYFCSLANPLKILFKEPIISVAHNTLLKFSKGVLTESIVVPRKFHQHVAVYGYNSYNDEWLNYNKSRYYPDFHFSDTIYFNTKKRRYVNKENKLIDGSYKSNYKGELNSTIGKPVYFDKGFLVKSYFTVKKLHEEIKNVKEFLPELIAERLKPAVELVLLDFYEIKVNNSIIFYFRDDDGILHYCYNRKNKFIEDFITYVNGDDYRLCCHPVLKIKKHEGERNY